MAFCPNCGTQIDATMRFCPGCGAAISSIIPNTVAAQGTGTYRVILITRDDCSRKDAIDLLEDLFGYSQAEAAIIVDGAPTEVVRGLTLAQARYIGQAMEEYGMDVSVYNGNTFVDLGFDNDDRRASVFNNDGSLLSTVAAALLGIGAANRVRYTRWVQPIPVRRTRYRRPTPVPRRRGMLRPMPGPVARPMPGPVARPAPAPVPRPVQPAPPRPAQPAPPRPGDPNRGAGRRGGGPR